MPRRTRSSRCGPDAASRPARARDGPACMPSESARRGARSPIAPSSVACRTVPSFASSPLPAPRPTSLMEHIFLHGAQMATRRRCLGLSGARRRS
jgi:hypothetical protein